MRFAGPLVVLAFLVPVAAAAFADSGEIVIRCKGVHIFGASSDCHGQKSWKTPADASGVYRVTVAWTPVDPAYDVLSAQLYTTSGGVVSHAKSVYVTGRSPLTLAIPVDSPPDRWTGLILQPSNEEGLGFFESTEIVVRAPDQRVSYTFVNEP